MTFSCRECQTMLDGLTCPTCGKVYLDPFRKCRRLMKMAAKLAEAVDG